MDHRLASFTLAGAALTSLGCSLLLELDGYETAQTAGPDGGLATRIGGLTANFDSYEFQRGSARVYSVPAARGLLVNDAENARALARAVTTRAGGRVEIGSDGRFDYTPPGSAVQ